MKTKQKAMANMLLY